MSTSNIFNLFGFLAPDAGGGGYQIERSLRFNSADSAYLSRTPASAGNRKTWTWAGWVKRAALSTTQNLFSATGFSGIRFESNNDLRLFDYTGSFQYNLLTTQVFRDASAWYHILVLTDTTQATASNRVKLFVNGSQVTTFSTATYPSQNYATLINASSLHYLGTTNASAELFSGYLADIHFIDGQALDPSSFGEFDTNGVWQPKAYTGTYGANGFHLPFSDNSTAAALGTDTSGNGNDWTVNNISTLKTSVTGPAIYASSTLYTTVSAITANATPLGNGGGSVSGKFLYVVMNDGGKVGTVPFSSGWSALVRTHSYNPTTAAWANTGSFGTTEFNSFTYSNDGAWSAYDLDNSGPAGFMVFSGFNSGNTPSDLYTGTVPTLNTANFNTLASLNVDADSLVDTPTNVSQTDTGVGGEVIGNYCTLNPLTSSAVFTISNGSLDITDNGSSAPVVLGTIAVNSGKWYWEITLGNQYAYVGAAQVTSRSSVAYLGATTGQFIYNTNSPSSSFINGTIYNYSTASAATTGNVLGVALDFDSNTITFYKNGVSQGTFGSSVLGTSTWAPAFKSNVSTSAVFNFGQRPFAYTAPSGFKALCTTNLPEPTIADGSTAMDVTLWTGDNTSNRVITSSLNHNPDLVWVKARSASGYEHAWFDALRSTNMLASSNTASESTFGGTAPIGGYVTNAGSGTAGFTVTPGPTNAAYVNQTGVSYVGWTWDAGTSTVTNTDGSITSQVRANASAGFSVVTVNSTTIGTIGHGLGVKPAMIIEKCRGTTSNWYVRHQSLGDMKSSYLRLNLTNAAVIPGDTTAWNNTEPTSTTISINNNYLYANGSVVYYCFAPVAGYSAFGSYTGNGSLDGPFVYTGMRPRWILIKRTDSVYDWYLFDSERVQYNSVNYPLNPNLTKSETDATGGYDPPGYRVDFLSNGFKLRNLYFPLNQSNGNYVYAAFGESPLQYARAR